MNFAIAKPPGLPLNISWSVLSIPDWNAVMSPKFYVSLQGLELVSNLVLTSIHVMAMIKKMGTALHKSLSGI